MFVYFLKIGTSDCGRKMSVEYIQSGVLLNILKFKLKLHIGPAQKSLPHFHSGQNLNLLGEFSDFALTSQFT